MNLKECLTAEDLHLRHGQWIFGGGDSTSNSVCPLSIRHSGIAHDWHGAPFGPVSVYQSRCYGFHSKYSRNNMYYLKLVQCNTLQANRAKNARSIGAPGQARLRPSERRAPDLPHMKALTISTACTSARPSNTLRYL